MRRVDARYRPVWEKCTVEQQIALARYFLPHNSERPVLAPTRPRLIKWYCPFASQREFPSGHRYCINVYTGCAHGCVYCYARSYEPQQASPKRDFARMLARDLADLDRFNVPPAPVHLSNSTDPLQPLELRMRHTMQALEAILTYRHRFTTVTLLTKNPLLVAQPEYVGLLKALDYAKPAGATTRECATEALARVQVEVSLAFWREDAAAFYDPHAPSVAERLDGIAALRAAGLPVVLRIDPLFPRSPLPRRWSAALPDFGLREAQTSEDLYQLLAFAKRVQVRHVVYSPLKIVQCRRGSVTEPMQRMLEVFRAISFPCRPVRKGLSWRMPDWYVRDCLVAPFLDMCRALGVTAKFCMSNVLETV
ncbi:MAG: hypothetical protein N2379_10750 [Verrucomicrobiae bacterium]|nr:hypothetical protein [Verrucomicrobiae bacterium]